MFEEASIKFQQRESGVIRTERLAAGCLAERGVYMPVKKELEELETLGSLDSLIEIESLRDMRCPEASFSGAVTVLYTCVAEFAEFQCVIPHT